MANENPEPEKKFDVEKYKVILKGLTLENLSLTKCSCSINREESSPDTSISITDKSSFKLIESGKIEISQAYHLIAKNQSSKKKLLEIQYEICAAYNSKEEFTEEFFTIFKKINLPINTWPFFREFVSSMTSRMYIPPITLPLLKR